jgi:endonuclease/exonuclease/phosphatase family metal-dependent hydrolase
MAPQRRWVHVVGVLVAAALVLGLFLLLGRTADGPDRVLPSPTTAPTPAPTPTPTPTLSAAPTPVTPSPPAPSITVPTLPTCVPTTTVTPLRVVTFNIHGGRSHTTYDLDRIIDEVASWDADVVLMQEVHRFRRLSGFDDQPALLASRLGMSYVFGRTYTRPPEGPGRPTRESGNLILSRLPILESANQALPRYPGQEPRALLHVTVEVGDQRVRIYDTHFQHTRGDIRIVQARAVRDLVSAPADGDTGPFLVGGDFNATPDSQPLTALSKVAADPWPVVGTSDGLTVPARAPRRRIDYVLHGGGDWTPRQAQTVLSAVSDHRAVVVDQDLSETDPCGSTAP